MHHALELFALRGYDAVGVQEIVESAGITKPTLYHFFGSKQGLLVMLFSESFKPFFSELKKAAYYQGDVAGCLKAITSTYFSFAQQQPALFRLYLSTTFAPVESESHKISRELSAQQLAIIEDMFDRASTDHGNMKNRQHAYAASFLGLVNTYATLILTGHVTLDESLVHAVVHQFMHGIFS